MKGGLVPASGLPGTRKATEPIRGNDRISPRNLQVIIERGQRGYEKSRAAYCAGSRQEDRSLIHGDRMYDEPQSQFFSEQKVYEGRSGLGA